MYPHKKFLNGRKPMAKEHHNIRMEPELWDALKECAKATTGEGGEKISTNGMLRIACRNELERRGFWPATESAPTQEKVSATQPAKMANGKKTRGRK
jgi:hypothetical protein